jgi:predicted NAD/FAD-binding protein
MTTTPTADARPTAEVVPATATPGHTIGPFFHDAFAWSAWNYLTTSKPTTPAAANLTTSSGALQTVCLTYDMNTLQHLPRSTFSSVLVTLNPPSPPSPTLTQATYQYRHPLYNSRMVFAQDRLPEIQGKRGIWFAGAWTGYGFHEDGCRSVTRFMLMLTSAPRSWFSS